MKGMIGQAKNILDDEKSVSQLNELLMGMLHSYADQTDQGNNSPTYYTQENTIWSEPAFLEELELAIKAAQARFRPGEHSTNGQEKIVEEHPDYAAHHSPPRCQVDEAQAQENVQNPPRVEEQDDEPTAHQEMENQEQQGEKMNAEREVTASVHSDNEGSLYFEEVQEEVWQGEEERYKKQNLLNMYGMNVHFVRITYYITLQFKGEKQTDQDTFSEIQIPVLGRCTLRVQQD